MQLRVCPMPDNNIRPEIHRIDEIHNPVKLIRLSFPGKEWERKPFKHRQPVNIYLIQNIIPFTCMPFGAECKFIISGYNVFKCT
jgi:hypothetical protein